MENFEKMLAAAAGVNVKEVHFFVVFNTTNGLTLRPAVKTSEGSFLLITEGRLVNPEDVSFVDADYIPYSSEAFDFRFGKGEIEGHEHALVRSLYSQLKLE